MRESAVHVEDHQIIVNLIDTRLTMTYRLSPEGQLAENEFWTVDGGDMDFPKEPDKQLF